MPKRKFESICGDHYHNGHLQAGATSSEASADLPPNKLSRREVRFDGVTLFYFERSQGFSCVPSGGGSTLGMTTKHHTSRRLSLGDHELELQQARRKTAPARLSLDAANDNRNLLNNGEQNCEEPDVMHNSPDEACAAAVNDEEDFADEAGPSGLGIMREDEAATDSLTSSEDEEVVEEGEYAEQDEEYCLQPLGIKERKALLRQAGVTDIDRAEGRECSAIRLSREICGCDCFEACEPATCFCAREEIKCQVDRTSFPCGCTKQGCHNPWGRVEFNALRVRSHYFNTMMRLRMEERRQAEGCSPKHIRFDAADESDNDYTCQEMKVGAIPGVESILGATGSNTYALTDEAGLPAVVEGAQCRPLAQVTSGEPQSMIGVLLNSSSSTDSGFGDEILIPPVEEIPPLSRDSSTDVYPIASLYLHQGTVNHNHPTVVTTSNAQSQGSY